jgi:hypothetical protein
MIIYAVRTKEQKAETFDNVGGVLKHWARTGKIDFHVVAPESSAPQRLILRVPKFPITEHLISPVLPRAPCPLGLWWNIVATVLVPVSQATGDGEICS